MLVLPLRNPVVLAKQTATLDSASGGRLSLGVAVGWYQKEFDAVGIPLQERGSIFLRNLRVLYHLWEGGPLNGEDGPHFFKNAVMAPAPVQRPRPEVLRKLAAHDGRFRRIATVLNDNGLRYLSTELCGESAAVEVPDRRHAEDPALAERLRQAASTSFPEVGGFLLSAGDAVQQHPAGVNN